LSKFDDAKTSLTESISANKAFLSDQDDATTLTATFAAADKIVTAVGEWVKGEVSIAAINAANEGEFDSVIHSEKIVDLRASAAKLAEYIVQAKRLITQFAVKARA
jgi:hypothetical protein